MANAGFGVSLTPPPGTSPFGPPQVEWNNELLPYRYTDTQGSSVYCDATASNRVVIDQNNDITAVDQYGNVQTGWGSGNGSSWQGILDNGNANFSAMTADGQNFLNPYAIYVTVYTSGWDPGTMAESNDDYYEPPYPFYYPHTLSFTRADGSAVFGYNTYEGGGYISFPGSPIYPQQSTIDATNGWPSGLSFAQAPDPVYINDSPVWGNQNGGDGLSWEEVDYYYGAPGPLALILSPGGGMFWYDEGGGAYSYSTDPPVYPPVFGYTELTLNGEEYTFSVDSNQQQDLYVAPSGDQITINADGTVNGTSVTYNPSTLSFDTSSNPSMSSLAFQDSQGNLVGVAPGVLITSATQPDGSQTVQLANGSSLSSSSSTVYIYQYCDGSWRTKFTGSPNEGLFFVQNSDGTSSPIYRYDAAVGNDYTVDYAGNGNRWPVSNLYPSGLYVNGHYAYLDGSTVSDAGIVPSRAGGASYVVADGRSVSIAWTWGSNGFSATVGGSYATFAQFAGTWDGNLFNGLPAGLVISTSPPSNGPSIGPPQLSWNGVNLTFDPVASSVSGSNPTGADVYHDGEGLGLTATIAADGTTTLTDSTGATFTGSYSAASGTFTFSGQSPGVTTAVNNQGGSSGVTASQDGQSMQINGNFDVQGNFLTMGTWTTSSGNSANSLSISYADAQGLSPSQLRFAASHQLSDWIWSEATADNTEPQVTMMELDPTHRLILHDTSTQNAPGVTLDPTGPSSFKNAVLLAPQGDISMGAFTNGSAP